MAITGLRRKGRGAEELCPDRQGIPVLESRKKDFWLEAIPRLFDDRSSAGW
jgi:hypothetical protein